MTFDDLWSANPIEINDNFIIAMARHIEHLESRVKSLEEENEIINQELAEREFGHSRNKSSPKYSRDMKTEQYVKVYYDDITKKYGKLKLTLDQVHNLALNNELFKKTYSAWVKGDDDRPTLFLNKKTGFIEFGTVEQYKRMMEKSKTN